MWWAVCHALVVRGCDRHDSSSHSVLAELRKMLSETGLVFTDHDARIVDGCSEGRCVIMWGV